MRKLNENKIWLLFLLILFLLIFYQGKPKPNVAEAEKLAELVTDDHPASLVSNGVLTDSRLNEINNMNYEDIKQSVNAKKDFCIYVEDENGKLMLSKGSSKLSEDGLPCVE